MLAAEINSLGGHLTEILDDHAPALRIGARIYPHPRIAGQVPAGLLIAALTCLNTAPPL